MVLDEADKLLSVDFQGIIEKIMDFVPKDRQILMVSATFPATVKDFIEKHQIDFHTVNLMDELTLKGVT